ncbi:MAG: KEOPS complex subunit Pcc1 [Thermoplasmata archaeon]|jgi:tRNA threonylcarbamoyladenosine modification (KEOPS) complex  Pcc1 subunit
MSGRPDNWSATVTVRLPDPKLAAWVEQALLPEAAREVPRSRAELRTVTPGTLELTISARDSGAMRAALNTYLGWVHLSLATAQASRRVLPPGDRRT